jgi:hypothetical protein
VYHDHGPWRRPRPGPSTGDSIGLRQKDEASGIRDRRSEDVGGVELRGDWGRGRAQAVDISERQCMVVAACASEWAQKFINFRRPRVKAHQK